VIPAGKKYEQPVISLDIFGTAAALNELKPKNPIDGVNLIPYLTGKDSGTPHQALFWRGSNSEKWAVRTPEDKLVILPNKTERFAIRNDIAEANDLHVSSPKRTAELQVLLNAWKTGLVPPAFMGLMEDKEYSEKHPDRFTPNR
jgi:arylsulfatase A-like enzyme